MTRPQFVSEEAFEAMKKRVRGVTSKSNECLRSRSMSVSASGKSSSPKFSPFQLALTGQLPSGKNQVQLLWRNGKMHRYPNKTFMKWRARSMAQITPEFFRAPNIKQPVSLTCDYWPGDARTRDVSGQLDAIFSLLVYAKILVNDGLVWSVLWRRHDMNRQFPKLVMEIEAWQS